MSRRVGRHEGPTPRHRDAAAVLFALATIGFGINFWAWALISPLGAAYRDRPVEVVTQAPVLLLPRVLDAAYRERLIQVWKHDGGTDTDSAVVTVNNAAPALSGVLATPARDRVDLDVFQGARSALGRHGA